ncbi:Sodium/hydrogen exchanger family-domain-containing protein [Rhodotorula diobovata]|uniref:Sodium/hydrogen exchanger family-domain-containing protein n=1 Tax=Rhodotorula diobovata TaxID=5288 RepID=A0A5C5FUF2_9BASI|nr:Sodium/hydrogen exchanger family-domain-containing protein [Rhodotorula diobovata]
MRFNSSTSPSSSSLPYGLSAPREHAAATPPQAPSPDGTVLYEEPTFVQLAILVSFLYVANALRVVANRLVGAGLLGECAAGIIYGPVAKILDPEWMHTFVAIGYIGLVLIVSVPLPLPLPSVPLSDPSPHLTLPLVDSFEGGLTLQPKTFLPQLPLACVVALVGILVPLALTFALFSASTFNYPPLEAFTAGSALASTSLGTTFFVLRSAAPELSTTAVGEVLKGAALIDDIVALVLLSVIQSLATGDDTASLGAVIGRPLGASVALAVVTPVVARWLFVPLFRARRVEGAVERGGRSAELFLGVAVLCAFLSIAYYAGTTMLLGAFLAGAFLSALPSPSSSVSFLACWDLWLVPLQSHLLTPLFFASIGFSLPFLSLWTGPLVWRGLVYACLMALGKVLAGGVLLVADALRGRGRGGGGAGADESKGRRGEVGRSEAQARRGEVSTEAEKNATALRALERGEDDEGRDALSSSSAAAASSYWSEALPAAAFVGLALVARGEIGILVLQLAYSSSSPQPQPQSPTAPTPVLTKEPYLIGIWAVALCTIAGPVAFGALVRRSPALGR